MIKKVDINNNEIIVKDQYLTEDDQLNFWYHANQCDYSFGQRSDAFRGSRQGRFTHHFDPAQFQQTSFWKLIETTVDSPIKLIDAYINCSDFATVSFPHTDEKCNCLSVLICLNQEWHRDWGGYTVFFDSISKNKILDTVIPEPGKAIFFNGRTTHNALAITPTAKYQRFMLVLKTAWN